MRKFAQKGFNIEKLATEAKIVYTAFLVFSIAALAVSALYYAAITENQPVKGAGAYYAGSQPATTSMGQEEGKFQPEDGPSLELPDDFEEITDQPLIVAMSTRKLLEVTHFHLFTIPVFLLIITHIFMLCSLSRQTKMGWILSGVASTAVHMAAPWVIYASGPSAAWLMSATGSWMGISMGVLTLWPMYFMWRAPRASRDAVAS